MRLKTSIWVAAYLRRCQTEGVFGAVRKKGAEEAGAVFVKVALMDGNAMLYAPAPQTVYDDSRPVERLFVATAPQPVSEPSVEERLTKELRFDPDAGSSRLKTAPGGIFSIWRRPRRSLGCRGSKAHLMAACSTAAAQIPTSNDLMIGPDLVESFGIARRGQTKLRSIGVVHRCTAVVEQSVVPFSNL